MGLGFHARRAAARERPPGAESRRVKASRFDSGRPMPGPACLTCSIARGVVPAGNRGALLLRLLLQQQAAVGAGQQGQPHQGCPRTHVGQCGNRRGSRQNCLGFRVSNRVQARCRTKLEESASSAPQNPDKAALHFCRMGMSSRGSNAERSGEQREREPSDSREEGANNWSKARGELMRAAGAAARRRPPLPLAPAAAPPASQSPPA